MRPLASGISSTALRARAVPTARTLSTNRAVWTATVSTGTASPAPSDGRRASSGSLSRRSDSVMPPAAAAMITMAPMVALTKRMVCILP
ncbi:hypothetical protein [Paracoccus sp. NBH48]|uniref:hypothetical protein n=1 Tax=Paracoccus sp. NBH48 TaxID=2596918 RepID=UPI001891A3E0|nr:hypothetical protein [Paracoccus sp. NBH48]